MLEVKDITVRGFDLDWALIEWTVGDFDGSSVTRYQFSIERSESPYGPFTTIGGPFTDIYAFRDVSPALLHHWRTLYYRIKVLDTLSADTQVFGPSAQIPEPSLPALEARRLLGIRYRQHQGRLCWAFPIRTFGPRCFCWDKVSRQRTRSNCVDCFDTGFLGGYLAPVEAYVQIITSEKVETETLYRREQPLNVSARLPSFPPIKPGDILVEAENFRWRVAVDKDKEINRSSFEQSLVLHKVPKGDVNYKLPINISDLRALSPLEKRSHTNPQYVDIAPGTDDIISVFARR